MGIQQNSTKFTPFRNCWPSDGLVNWYLTSQTECLIPSHFKVDSREAKKALALRSFQNNLGSNRSFQYSWFRLACYWTCTLYKSRARLTSFSPFWFTSCF